MWVMDMSDETQAFEPARHLFPEEGWGGTFFMASLTRGVFDGRKRAFQYQERRPAPHELVVFLFSGAGIGYRNQMRRENVRGLGGDLA